MIMWLPCKLPQDAIYYLVLGCGMGLLFSCFMCRTCISACIILLLIGLQLRCMVFLPVGIVSIDHVNVYILYVVCVKPISLCMLAWVFGESVSISMSMMGWTFRFHMVRWHYQPLLGTGDHSFEDGIKFILLSPFLILSCTFSIDVNVFIWIFESKLCINVYVYWTLLMEDDVIMWSCNGLE